MARVARLQTRRPGRIGDRPSFAHRPAFGLGPVGYAGQPTKRWQRWWGPARAPGSHRQGARCQDDRDRHASPPTLERFPGGPYRRQAPPVVRAIERAQTTLVSPMSARRRDLVPALLAPSRLGRKYRRSHGRWNAECAVGRERGARTPLARRVCTRAWTWASISRRSTRCCRSAAERFARLLQRAGAAGIVQRNLADHRRTHAALELSRRLPRAKQPQNARSKRARRSSCRSTSVQHLVIVR